MTLFLILFLGALGALMTWRYLYMSMMRRWWEEAVVLYVIGAKVHHTKVVGLIAIWPMHLIMGYVWEWDFARFIVDQEGAKTVLDFLERSATVPPINPPTS